MIFRSPLQDVGIPAVSLTDYLFEAGRRTPEKPAFIDGLTGRAVTYGEWMAGSRGVAAGLTRRGLVKGDVVALFSPNLPEYAAALHGTALAGGVVTTANPTYTAREFRAQLEDCQARFVVTAPGYLETVRAAVDGLPVEEIFVFGEAGGATPFAELAATTGPAPDVAIDPARDLAVLPYSSGTTGLPKGVMLTHRNLVANVQQTLAATSDAGPGDVFLGLLPFFHIYGMVVVLNGALRLGATIVTLPRFEMHPFLESLERHRVTYAYLVPPVILALAKHPDVGGYDLSSLRTITSGAAPLGREVAEACGRRLGCRFSQGYGLTETSPVTHMTPPGVFDEAPGSIGPCVPNTEVKVIDPEGRVLRPGERGEICIRGPQVMAGYLNRPEATAAMIDGEGWLRTGDLGYGDERGRFYIVDRLKELIKYKGCQVPPAELEALLLTHPAVADAAVIGLPDAEAGEIPKAFVVLRQPAAPEEIQAWVAERVAPYKRLHQVEVVDTIPRSASGKILRRVLADPERNRRGA